MTTEGAKVVVDLMLGTETGWMEVLQELVERRELFSVDFTTARDSRFPFIFRDWNLKITERISRPEQRWKFEVADPIDLTPGDLIMVDGAYYRVIDQDFSRHAVYVEPGPVNHDVVVDWLARSSATRTLHPSCLVDQRSEGDQ